MHSDRAEQSSPPTERDAAPTRMGSYRLDPRRSLIGFAVRHLTGRVHGTFLRATGTVSYDPRWPEKTEVRVVIQTASLVTHNYARDARLRSYGFLDARRHPQITFVSTSALRVGRKLEVTGELAIRGVTRPVTLSVGKVRSSGTGDTRVRGIHAVAKATLHRSDFGVGPSGALEGGALIGDEIAVDIDVELVSD